MAYIVMTLYGHDLCSYGLIVMAYIVMAYIAMALYSYWLDRHLGVFRELRQPLHHRPEQHLRVQRAR